MDSDTTNLAPLVVWVINLPAHHREWAEHNDQHDFRGSAVFQVEPMTGVQHFSKFQMFRELVR
jgi:hypothetical protein